MASPATWRGGRPFFRHFRIDAPRMAVRAHLPWPWRAAVTALLLAMVGGMSWWGFDFGQFFGGFNRREVEGRITALETANARLKEEARALRAKSSQQESELAITFGVQATLARQAREVSNENAQLKDELAFLQKLVADSSKQGGLAIQRLVVERERDGAWRYSLLVVRGGSPRAELEGALTLQVALQPAPGTDAARATVLTLPDDDPATASVLKLRFKYFQRVEGTIRVPPGAQVRSVTARAFEAGQPSPRATRTLVIS